MTRIPVAMEAELYKKNGNASPTNFLVGYHDNSRSAALLARRASHQSI